MKVKYFAAIATAAVITVGLIGTSNASVTRSPNTAISQSSLVASNLTRYPGYYTENGIALDGQDVVSYFTESKLVSGSKEFSYQWKGANWMFSSAANRDLFAQNPEKYAPQYGGYCSKAAAGGVLATTVPTAWEVRNGKLYLNYSADAQKEWKQDTESKIVQANSNWPKILDNDSLKR